MTVSRIDKIIARIQDFDRQNDQRGVEFETHRQTLDFDQGIWGEVNLCKNFAERGRKTIRGTCVSSASLYTDLFPCDFPVHKIGPNYSTEGNIGVRSINDINSMAYGTRRLNAASTRALK